MKLFIFIFLFSTSAFAQEAAPFGMKGGMGTNIAMIMMLVAIFYFFIIRPQSRKVKEHDNMVNAIERGDTVMTSGGLIGKIVKVGDTEMEVELAKDVVVRVVKATVSDVIEKKKKAVDKNSKK